MQSPEAHPRRRDTTTGTFLLPRVPQGSGSGLNADLLDGLDSTDFLRVGSELPVVGDGTTERPLSLARATTTVDGHLAAEDFLTFASKVDSVVEGPGISLSGAPTAPQVSARFGASSATVTEGNDPRLSDARTPLSGSAHYIQNQSTSPQSASYSISGNATVGGWSHVAGNMSIGASGNGDRLLVNGDLRIGTVENTPVTTAGAGPSLLFSGGPTVNSNHGSDNSDPLSIARYNVSSDVTELRVSLGDNGVTRTGNIGLYDRFVIGAPDFSIAGWFAAFSVDTSGTVRSRGSMVANSTPDLAETIAATREVEIADVVCADPTHAERITRCTRATRHVLGVVSDGSSSFLINAYAHTTDAALTGQPLVLAGRVPVKVSSENGPIHIGDALSPSSTPGVAMKAIGSGPIVGVALDAFDGPMGRVLCFVSPGNGDATSELSALRAENAALTQRLERLEARLEQLR